MSFNRIYQVILLIGGVLCSANLAAQQIDSSFLDINYVRKQNAWISSKNAAGLKYFKWSKASSADFFFDKSDGQFKNFHQSDNSYEYGLNAYSLYRLNPKMVFEGSISYHNFKGKNMGGSAFIDPYKNPFDIVERDDANKGTKVKETFSLNGALSAQLSSKFAVGGRISYQAANFAKTKDLRHINKLLDMEVSMGAVYRASKVVEIGANYNYDRRIESILFKTYGNVDKPISSLISFGSFYGMLETFGSDGYTRDSQTNPLVNTSQGFSFQLNLYLSKKMSLLNEFTYGRPKGYFGEKGTISFLLAEHEGEKYSYKGVISVLGDQNEHQIAFTASYNSLLNNDNSSKRETNPGGASSVSRLSKEVLDQQRLQAEISYIFFKDIKNLNPAWVFGVDMGYFRRQQTTKLYPFYRDQTINSYQVKTSVKRNIVKTDQLYSLALGVGYGAGSGLAKDDGFYIPPSGGTAPINMDMYLNQEFEYFTKPRAMAEASLQYTKKLKQHIAPYVKLNYSFTKAFDTQALGSSFGVGGLSIGCNF